MKVYLQIIGIPELRKIIGSDLAIDAECDTILGLIDQLCQSYGKRVKDIFYPNNKTLTMNIQVLVNNKFVLPREKLKEKIIKENDNITFMLYIGGG